MPSITEKQLLKDLFSDNYTTLISSIKSCSEFGTPQILRVLLELMKDSTDKSVKTEIILILNNLKDSACREIIIDKLSNPDYKKLRKDLIASCWESGLDYQHFLKPFIELFAEENFETAFEAFTVLDNTEIDKVTIPDLEELINFATSKKSEITTDKIGLYETLLLSLREKTDMLKI